MIKSLYLRVALILIGAVLLSLILAFFVSSLLFSNQVEKLLKEDLIQNGKSIIQTYEESSPDSFEAFIEGVSTFSNYRIQIYNERGEQVYVGERIGKQRQIGQEPIAHVIKGGIFKGDEGVKEKDMSNRLIIGLPLRIDGIPHALFIAPAHLLFMEYLRKCLFIVLLIVLGFGSLIIFASARYLVKPLHDFTQATRRIAQGDFTVRLTNKRKDEIGILTDSINHMAAELGMLDKMRQDFVANVSHEIQSPLTSISGFSKALKTKPMDEPSRQHYLSIIEHESERLSRLSENLMQLSSLQYEHHPFHPQPYRLDEQIRRVVITCEPLWSARQQSIEVELEEILIEADEDQLNQVWINLLGNSIKFTPVHGDIRIELKMRKGFAIVKISDNGIGIPEEELVSVFKPFYKVDKSRDHSTNGSGLGLSITKRIIDIHSGTIQVRSIDRKGTDIIVKLPLEQLLNK
ncbi:MAG: sensor histidine kinase [Paenibacillus sp.]|jgi:signal transduction histidine kinase|nr:sensor histidine kinase [Paenibacillus sp.]